MPEIVALIERKIMGKEMRRRRCKKSSDITEAAECTRGKSVKPPKAPNNMAINVRENPSNLFI